MMNKALSPANRPVKPGALINLIVYGAEGGLRRRQFLVLKEFDHHQILGTIRNEGIVKSEEVLIKLSEILLNRGIVKPVDSYTLDLGDLGRPSTALKSYYKHSLNADSSTLLEMIQQIDKSYYTFMSEEGELQLLKLETGDTLAHVQVILEFPNELVSYTTLDLTGPPDADYPETLTEEIQVAIMEDLMIKWPQAEVAVTVRIRKSELASAKEALLIRQ